MTINRFIWTDHAELRIAERGLSRAEVERTINDRHDSREVNRGDADWRVQGTRPDSRSFIVIYDHPAMGSTDIARIVSVWPLRS